MTPPASLPRQEWTIIDLSLPLSPRSSETTKPRLKRTSHRQGAFLLALKPLIIPGAPWRTLTNLLAYLLGPRRIPPRAFPERQALAWETVTSMTHRATHVDAPAHYGPSCDGRPAPTIDQLDLHWFFAPGVRLDFRHKEPGSTISAREMAREVDERGLEICEGTIALVMTGTDKHWKDAGYLENYPGLSADAVEFLLDRGVRVIGIDADSLDRPGAYMLQDYLSTRNANCLWPAHFLGRRREYYHLENLAHLDRIPCDQGFYVCCFPVAVEAGTAGWTRAVALVPTDVGRRGERVS